MINDPQPPAQSLRQKITIPVLIYLIVLGAYLGCAAGRLKKASSDNHYVYQAYSLLKGRLSLEGSPPHQNDWALVYELELNDGRKVRGTFLKTGGTGRFKTTKGERMIITDDMIRTRNHVYYVSFPILPALLMLPFVAIFGMKFNDVIFTAALGAFNPVLVYWVLRKLRALGLSDRTRSQELWLVGLFAFGTVHFFSSVMGQVWYTAHIVGVMVTCLYVMAALGGRHPFLSGLMLGLGFIARTTIPFTFPLVVGEILRRNLRPKAEPEAAAAADADADAAAAAAADAAAAAAAEAAADADAAAEAVADSEAEADSSAAPCGCRRPPLWARVREVLPRVMWKPVIKQLIIAGVPAVAVAGFAFLLNFLRFDNPFEFGHYYLNVVWMERIQRWGLLNFHFVSRNLAVMLTLLPWILARPPYIKISWHGLALWFTTPPYLLLLWPRRRNPVQPWLYLSCMLPMLLHMFYQNSGWVQFGYRFSLDYAIFLICLLAVGGYRFGIIFKVLVLHSVVVNTFGAVTFNRFMQFFQNDLFRVR